MVELTKKERLVYDYIDKYIEDNGYPPTIRDICDNTGIKSTSTAHAYIGRLEEKGVIVRGAGKKRALNTISRSTGNVELKIPVLGRVTAGIPIFVIENFEGYVSFDPNGHRYRENELFALKVKGVSMIDAGILDGDIVIVRKSDSADNGDIVVAMIDDEATVKTFYRENGHFRLQPENSSLPPIIVDRLTILGQVVASLRYYE